MSFNIYDLKRPFYDGICSFAYDRNSDIDIEARKKLCDKYDALGPGPFLRYERDSEHGKAVKLYFTGRRYYEFRSVGGPMELVFIDGRVEKVEGNRIELPKDSCTPVPCCNEEWKSWKQWPDELEGLYVLEKGVVLFEYFNIDFPEHTIKVYKEGKEIYKFEGATNCDLGEGFFGKLLESYENGEDLGKFEKLLIDYHNSRVLPGWRI